MVLHEHLGESATSARSVVDRLCTSWLTRAAVRSDRYIEDPEPAFDPALNDFPPGLLPFKNHPAYVALDERAHRLVETLAWIAWNKRVVDTEEQVVCKALMAVMSGATDIALLGPSRTAIRQTLIDEAFHSHMHEVAAALSARQRNIPSTITDRICRPAYGTRSYRATAATMTEPWERDIALLTWAVVGELSIYEFLTIVSNDRSIQLGSRTLLELHERDEAAHASVVEQVLRAHHRELGERQAACFARCLPLAMNSLSQQDWAVWQDILELAGVREARDIVADVQQDRAVPDQLPMLRSYQRIEHLCADLGIKLSASTQEAHAHV